MTSSVLIHQVNCVAYERISEQGVVRRQFQETAWIDLRITAHGRRFSRKVPDLSLFWVRIRMRGGKRTLWTVPSVPEYLTITTWWGSKKRCAIKQYKLQPKHYESSLEYS